MEKQIPDTKKIRIAVEDRFLIIGIREAKSHLPSIDTAECLAKTVSRMKGDYTLVVDIRGLRELYADVDEFIWGLGEGTSQKDVIVLVRNKLEQEILGVLTSKKISSFKKLLGVKTTTPRLYFTSLNLEEFETDIDKPFPRNFLNWIDSGCPDLPDRYKGQSPEEDLAKNCNIDEARRYYDGSEDEYRIALLWRLINKYGRNSLLNEFAFAISKNNITLTPYHSCAFYKTEAPEGSEIIIARPGVIAKQTGNILSYELHNFEALVNKPHVSESEIQTFLENNPHFFNGLNYKNVYPQITLERPSKQNLIPDFICEPIGSEWAEILDLKIPIAKPIDVGGENRARLAAIVTDGIAQLREYAAWFEDEQNFKSFRKKYGLSVYKPKLKLIVGRDPHDHDEKQLRRMMTAYSDIDIITYDQFLQICKSRLLI